MTRRLCKASRASRDTKAFVIDGLDTKPTPLPSLCVTGAESLYTNCFVSSLLYTNKSQCGNVANCQFQIPIKEVVA